VLLIAVAVAVLGGLESTVGLVVGGLILGYSQVIAATILGTQWQSVVYLVAIILVLAIRPSGLFGKFKELEERV
jgi:branched-chain amino acid transport system permease protein